MVSRKNDDVHIRMQVTMVWVTFEPQKSGRHKHQVSKVYYVIF